MIWKQKNKISGEGETPEAHQGRERPQVKGAWDLFFFFFFFFLMVGKRFKEEALRILASTRELPPERLPCGDARPRGGV